MAPFPESTSCDAEKEVLARRVHDLLGQPLTALKFMMCRTAVSPEESRRLSEEASALINEMQVEVRRLLVSLQPASGDADLLSSLDMIISQYNRVSQMHVSLRRSQSLAFLVIPADITQVALAFIRQSLATLNFQPGITEVNLKVWETGDNLNVRIEDKSNGFTRGEITRDCPGLNPVRQAARPAPGEAITESANGAGARITARFPLAKQ